MAATSDVTARAAPTTVVILAAGQGTRMKSELPKVLHEVAGRPMVLWAVESAREVTDDIAVVVGYQADRVQAVLPDDVMTVLQAEQNGTGHAVQLALAAGAGREGVVVVIPGDTPQLRGSVLAALAERQADNPGGVTLLTAEIDDPTGFGRILRDDEGRVVGIVEHRDATPAQLDLNEVNASVYAFDAGALRAVIDEIDADNAQNEIYLTDAVGLLREGAQAMVGEPADSLGVNSPAQLAEVDAVMRDRITADLMEAGVKIIDPSRTYIDAGVKVAPGAVIYPETYLQGETSIEADAVVGPSVFMGDSTVGAGARVWYSVVRDSQIGSNTEVGPFASLRAGTITEDGAKIGTFVETKNTRLGEGSKVPHLSYMGDAEVGKNSNIGAGSITCNYDGYEKHKTVIGDHVRVGSDTMLVAPIELGDESWTGAGSPITKAVPPGALAGGRAQPREVADYAAMRKKKADRE